VTDWPQFDLSEEEGRYVSAHHPYTMPKEEDIPLLAEDPAKVYAVAYDIVLNGYELGGGSIRIHTRELQEKVLETLGFTKEQMEEQFG
ncbi:amino acid--tRNA ligase-related protein, partial [Enterococcus faecium]|uniref:amino acid--tRNA ligase-related protein n=1 Tax=Enterococcus faecium TaxID=1352 RepID=UPI003CC55BC1